MLRQEVEEQLAERLIQRIEDTNTFILKKIGEAIKQISTLKPSQAYQLSQILKYGGSYQEIAKELARVSGKNVQEIYKIFDEVAKNNKQFAKEFYRFRNIDYIPYAKDVALQNQVKGIATLTANTYINISNTSTVGLVQNGQFKQLQQAYTDIIDKAILSVSEGKQDFYSSMRQTLKELGGNGLVQYESGRTRRLDSAVRMNILDGIRQLNNETSRRFGAEYDADGIEISVHENPAPDHADIQGRQFSNEEYDKLENGQIAIDYKGIKYDGSEKRHISEYNCYHKIFTIVLGISKPEYTDEELEEIKQRNENGFELDGKHYTMYEGTQMQRKLELAARKQKDINILAKASGDKELAKESEIKIRKITQKYKELCETSGLKPKKQRMSVSGYVRTKVNDIKEQIKPVKLTPEELDNEFYMLSQDLEQKNVNVDNSIFNLTDKELRNEQLKQLDKLTNEYKHSNTNGMLTLTTSDKGKNNFGSTRYSGHIIYLNKNHFTTKENVIQEEIGCMNRKWHFEVPDDRKSIYTLTHEYGHILEYEYLKKATNNIVTKSRLHIADKDLKDILITNAMNKLDKKITITQFKEKYLSKYANSKRNYEWFAETFAKYKLGEKDVWTETFGEWLEGYFNGK